MNWIKIDDSYICNKIFSVVKEGVNRLIDPIKVEEDRVKLIQERKDSGKEYIVGSSIDLARGYGGFCVLLGELDKIEPNEGWDKIGHCYLQEIQNILVEKGVMGLGLWTGLSGVIIAAKSLSRNGERYKKFISNLNCTFINSFMRMFKDMRLQESKGIKTNDIDVIQGISGIGRYVLAFSEDKKMKEILENILLYLVYLCKYIDHDGVKVPGWFISFDNYMGYDRENYTNGHFNCGMAHGITGILALMSISSIKGIVVEGQNEAIKKIVNWLIKFRSYDKFGPIWPGKVSWEENIEGKVEDVFAREAWCYGDAGVARAIWLSGVALNNNEWKEISIDTFKGICRRPEEKWNIKSHTFCHGRAGLLQIVQRMYSESEDKEIKVLRDRLVNEVLELWNPSEPYGYHEEDGLDIQHIAGLLDGAAGVFAVLIGLTREEDSDWDSIFLIC
ncbi:MAG: hypothetical protein E7214_10415 [Clostridium sp.]|nr:hypothetical protein [Clostridium sp.]